MGMKTVPPSLTELNQCEGALESLNVVTLQSFAKRLVPGLVNFISALAYHFCLAFTQRGARLLAKPYTYKSMFSIFNSITFSLQGMFGVGYLVVFVFVMTNLGGFNCVEQRVYLSLAGIFRGDHIHKGCPQNDVIFDPTFGTDLKWAFLAVFNISMAWPLRVDLIYGWSRSVVMGIGVSYGIWDGIQWHLRFEKFGLSN